MDEYIEYNKIYAHADENCIVRDIYSEAFKQPQADDICIDSTNTDRHGANAYQVYDEDGIANYTIVNGALVERDKTAELAKTQQSDRIAELKDELARTDYQAIKYAEGVISAEEYEPMRIQREEWRQEIRKIEAELGL